MESNIIDPNNRSICYAIKSVNNFLAKNQSTPGYFGSSSDIDEIKSFLLREYPGVPYQIVQLGEKLVLSPSIKIIVEEDEF